MPARKKATPAPARSKPAARRPRSAPAAAGQPGGASSAAGVQAAGGAGGTVASDTDSRSSETQVVRPAEDEPVRCGGYVLTENGWVLEDGPVPADNDGGDAAADEQE